MSFDYPGRIKRLQAAMHDSGIDAALLSVGADLPYFTGYEARPSERLTVLVAPDVGEPVLFVPELEAPRVGGEVVEVRSWGETEDPVALAAAVVPDPARVAVGDHMWSVFLTRFQKEWTTAGWIPASEITRELRIRKDPTETELLRAAAHGVDRVMSRIPLEVRFGGRTEIEVARHLMEMTIEEGHDVAEFAIVASGPNGASPHHHAGDRVIDEGDLVVCDYGGRWGGYHSDSTRSFVVGEPSPQQVEVHAVVLGANEAGRAAVAPGVACEEIDRAARQVITGAGYGEYFIHRTGHGIGLEVHEHPYLVTGNDEKLEVGMTFSVEPGIYLPDRFGVRIEDIVVCAEDGVDSLNESPRGLVSVA
ncbi:MAG: M24 family metallopeptidase [Acidimicrobiia bacterium]